MIWLNFYLSSFVVIISLIIGIVLPKISIKKEDVTPLTILLILFILTTQIHTPQLVYFGESDYLALAENIAQGKGHTYCRAYELGKCVEFEDRTTKPPGFSALVSLLILRGLSPLDSARALNLLLNIGSIILFYLMLRRKRSKVNSLILSTIFVFLVPRIWIQKTSVATITSTFFFIMFFYFLDSENNFKELTLIISTLLFIRPENLFILSPFILWILYVFYEKKPHEKEDSKIFMSIFLLYLLINTYHLLSAANQDALWSESLRNSIKIFSGKIYNLDVFLSKNFNFLLFPWFLFNIKSLRKDTKATLLLLSILISIGVFISFIHGSFMGSNGSRYFIITGTLTLIFLMRFVPKNTNLAVLLAAFSILIVPLNNFYSESYNQVFVNEVIKNSNTIKSEQGTIFFVMPPLIHTIYPQKKVSIVYNLGKFQGEGLYVYYGNLQNNAPKRSIPKRCNTTLAENHQVIEIFNISC